MRNKSELPDSGAGQPSKRSLQDARGRFGPLTHLLFAGLAGAGSLTIAWLILWPGSPVDRLGSPVVIAADSSRESVQSEASPVELQSPAAHSVAARVALVPRPTEARVAEEESSAGRLVCNVLDEFWQPVPEAQIWIDDGGWRPAGLSDELGRFDLHFDPRAWERMFDAGDAIRLGARAVGRRPSLVTTIEEAPPTELRLVLRGPGAALRLQVETPEGRAIPDARIDFLTTTNPRSPESLLVLVSGEEWAQPTPAPGARTDVWGTAVFDGLEPGTRSLAVRAEGYRSRTERVQLAPGPPLFLRLSLAPIAGLSGVALGPDGRPIPGTIVCARGIDGSWECMANGDDQGRFEFFELPAQVVQLTAEARTQGVLTHQAQTTLSLIGGRVAHWDPVLGSVRLLTGRLLDARGLPLSGWRVEGQSGEGEPAMNATSSTDENGAYDLAVSPRTELLQVLFFHPSAAGGFATRTLELAAREREAPIVELEEDEEFVSPIRGRLLASNGEGLPAGPVLLKRLADHSSLTLELFPGTGRFESPALPPGSYVLTVPMHGRGWAFDQRLVVNGREPLELGTIELPATGQLHLQTENSNRREFCAELRIDLLRPGIAPDYAMPVLLGSIEIPIQLELAPGSYRLRQVGADERSWTPLTIESGQTTLLAIAANE